MSKKSFWMTLGFTFGSAITLAKCSQLYNETSPIYTGAYDPTEEWQSFNELCERECEPNDAVIIGEPIPGRVDEDTYCVCTGKRPRVAASWR